MYGISVCIQELYNLASSLCSRPALLYKRDDSGNLIVPVGWIIGFQHKTTTVSQYKKTPCSIWPVH